MILMKFESFDGDPSRLHHGAASALESRNFKCICKNALLKAEKVTQVLMITSEVIPAYESYCLHLIHEH